MLLKTLSVILVLLSGNIAAAYNEGYEGYKKYFIEHPNEEVRNYMVGLQTESINLDFWIITSNASTVVVPPELLTSFEETLNQIGAPYKATNLELNTVPEEDDCYGDECPLKRTARQSSGGFFRSFHRYDTILQYMYALARRYPQYIRFESIGRSVEGRTIGALSISLSRNRGGNKLAYIQGGTHAREWITPSTVLYFATELVSNIHYYRRIIQNLEIVIVPVLNPDGYEYSHTRDRYWRKNRHPFAGVSCRGVDINRNFGLYWNYVGSSQNPCSEVYSGRQPYSEPETQAVKHFLERNRGRTKLVLDLHSFGKFIFYPYGYTKAPVANRNFLHSIGLRAANAIAKYRGTVYTVGSSATILYEASGGLDDYSHGILGVPLSYTLELPGHGFEIPTSEIIPVGKETFSGIIEFIRHISLV